MHPSGRGGRARCPAPLGRPPTARHHEEPTAHFGTRAGLPGKGYYGVDIGTSWHVVVQHDDASLGGTPSE